MAGTLTVRADGYLFLWTDPEADAPHGLVCSALAQNLGYMTWPQNFWVPVAKTVYHAPQYPACKNVGSSIPYKGVVRIML